MHCSILVTRHFRYTRHIWSVGVHNECVHNGVVIHLASVYDTAIVIYAYLFLRLSPLSRNTSFKEGKFKADIRSMVYVVGRVHNHGSTSYTHSRITTNYNAPSGQEQYFHRCRTTNCSVVSLTMWWKSRVGKWTRPKIWLKNLFHQII
jgi:hypothetical protein